jgi:hypothetical protein
MPGGDAAVSFTLAEAGGVEVGYQQGTGSVFALYREPEPGFACDDGHAIVSCGYVDNRAGAAAYPSLPAGRYIFVFKAQNPMMSSLLTVRFSAFGNRKVEICSNGIDDDDNGLTDCDDPACIGVGSCAAPACTPDQNLGAISWGTTKTFNVDTRGAKDLYTAPCGKGDGPERVVGFMLTQPMSLGVDCKDGGSHVLFFTQQLAALDRCDEHDVRCADPQTLPFGCGFAIPDLQPGQYYLVVEAFDASSTGPIGITLTGEQEIVREICDNGFDDDKDGKVDCMDLKCVTSPICEKFACRPDKLLDIIPLDGSVAQTIVQTTGSGDEQTASCVSAAGGEDAVIDFQLPARADLTLEWAQIGNHDLALYSDDGVLLSCEAGISYGCVRTEGALTGSTTFFGIPSGRYHLVVDADAPGRQGGVAIQLSGKAAP